MAEVSLRPAPRSELPFDDEGGPPAGRQLTLEWRPAAGPARPVAAARASPRASAEARLAVRGFVHLCVEVLNGYRPAAHLRRVSHPVEAAAVVAEGLAGAQRVAALRRGSARPRRRPTPTAVVRLHYCEPRPGAVEAAVALLTGDRTWAMALRMERHDDRWSATTLRLI